MPFDFFFRPFFFGVAMTSLLDVGCAPTRVERWRITNERRMNQLRQRAIRYAWLPRSALSCPAPLPTFPLWASNRHGWNVQNNSHLRELDQIPWTVNEAARRWRRALPRLCRTQPVALIIRSPAS